MALPGTPSVHTVEALEDGFRVMVSRGVVGPVAVSGLLTRSQAEALRDKLAENQRLMLSAGRTA